MTTKRGVSTPQPDEVWLDFEPAAEKADVGLAFIGQVESDWSDETAPPKNPREARERGRGARLHVKPEYRAGLRGLDRYSHVIVLVWLHRARRQPLVIKPPHADVARGVFAIRSPVRPNPIGLSVCKLMAVDETSGVIEVDAIDFLDGTPIVDIKPYRPGIDAVPDAVVG